MNFYVAYDKSGRVFLGYIKAKDIFDAIVKAQERWGRDNVWRVVKYDGVL